MPHLDLLAGQTLGCVAAVPQSAHWLPFFLTQTQLCHGHAADIGNASAAVEQCVAKAPGCSVSTHVFAGLLPSQYFLSELTELKVKMEPFHVSANKPLTSCASLCVCPTLESSKHTSVSISVHVYSLCLHPKTLSLKP